MAWKECVADLSADAGSSPSEKIMPRYSEYGLHIPARSRMMEILAGQAGLADALQCLMQDQNT